MIEPKDQRDDRTDPWGHPRGGRRAACRSGVAACPCMDIDERYLDPHFEDREVFTFCDHPATGTDVIPNLSWKMGVSNGSVYRPAPMMGEHNYYVFGELLGMSKQEIKSLEECSIIY